MAYTGPSIVDYLKSVGQPSDPASRATLAKQKGIANYTGLPEQNTSLLGILRGSQTSPVVATPTPTASTYDPLKSLANLASPITNAFKPLVQSVTQPVKPTQTQSNLSNPTPAATLPVTLTPNKSSIATPTPATTPQTNNGFVGYVNGKIQTFPTQEAAQQAGATGIQPNYQYYPSGATPTPTPATTPQSSAYTGTSIVDYLKSAGQASDYTSRAKLAMEKGIANYAGTPEQNIQLLNLLRGGQASTGTMAKTGFDTGAIEKKRLELEASMIPAKIAETEAQLKEKMAILQKANEAGYGPGGEHEGEDIPESIIASARPVGGVLGDLGAGVGADTVVTSDSARDAETKKTTAEIKADLDEATKDQAEIEKLSRQKMIQDLKTELGITDTTLPAKPAPTSLATDFQALRSTEGVTAIETQINSIDTEIAATESGMRAEIEKELGRLAPTENIGLRQIDIQKKYQDQLDSLNRRKSTLVSELNTKNTLISNIMGFKQTDYANASAAYQNDFNRNVSLINAVEGRITNEDQQANQVKDDARANLTLLTNMVNESGKTWDTLDPSLMNKIQELEMKAGMPAGVTETFARVMPGMKVDYTTAGYDAAGNQVVSFFSYNDGDPKLIKSINSGAVKAKTAAESGKPSETEVKRTAIQSYAIFMQPKLGQDGCIAPNDYKTARLGWVSETGYSADDFDKAFSHLRNPKEPYGAYGVTGQ